MFEEIQINLTGLVTSENKLFEKYFWVLLRNVTNQMSFYLNVTSKKAFHRRHNGKTKFYKERNLTRKKRLSIDISVCSVWTICKREPPMCVIEPRNSLKERRRPQKWEAFLFSLYFTLSHSSPSRRFYSRPNCLFKMHTNREQLRLKKDHVYTNWPLSITWSQSLWILISIFVNYSNCFRVT